MKIAAWSGPRNLSTGLMYSFAARTDCAVWDEPFYAAYLKTTGANHPMAAEVMAHHETDPAKITATCAGPIPDGKAHWYMKHMPHHMTPGFPLDWAETCVNLHLIRHPARVIASYAQKRETITLDDIGFAQQATLYDRLPGPVIDTTELRQNPAQMLQKLCAEIALPWEPAMLHWPPGPKPFDGLWAQHWYNAAHTSTGFAGPEGPLPQVAPAHQNLLNAALPYYEALRAQAL